MKMKTKKNDEDKCIFVIKMMINHRFRNNSIIYEEKEKIIIDFILNCLILLEGRNLTSCVYISSRVFVLLTLFPPPIKRIIIYEFFFYYFY